MNISAVLPARGVRLGLSGCLTITLLAAWLAGVPGFAERGLGWLPLAVALGMLVGNLWPALPREGSAGLAIARGPAMRAGIALYGLAIGVEELATVGWAGPFMAAAIVASTLLLAVRGGRWLGLDRHSALLVGAGSAICGAAAIAAADSVVGARARQVAAAVAAVVLFGTLSMYLLPLLQPLLPWPESAFGLWIGLTVHELGHVVAASAAVGPEAAASALVEKMLRVLFLVPAVIWIAVHESRAAGRSASAPAPLAGVRRLPAFLWAFLGAIFLNAFGLLPEWLHAAGTLLAQALLAIGLAALGAATRFDEVRQAGWRVWALASLLWLHLLVSGLLLVHALAPAA